MTDAQASTPPAQPNSAEEKQEIRKSQVRVLVTYAAACFLFLGGPLLIFILLFNDCRTEALAVFNALLPISAAIISYWFAGRQKQNDKNE